MSKLQQAVAGQYFTDKKMIELAKLIKGANDSVKNIDVLIASLTNISDNLECSTILLDKSVEIDAIEDVEHYVTLINAIVGALPKEIGALSKALNITKKKKGADTDAVLKGLGLTK